MLSIETDSENGTQIFRLVDDERPTDNIYGEQAYSSLEGDRIVIRHYPEGKKDGGLSVVNLEEASLHPILRGEPRFPAFHAWGKHLYYQEEIKNELVLRRCHYQTLKKEDVLVLPKVKGEFSYGTVSPDERFYAVNIKLDDNSFQLLLIDIKNGDERVLLESSDQYLKHEQFSLDGKNKVLIQANSSDVKVVNLGVVDINKEGISWLAVDAPPLIPIGKWPGGDRHTPRCTGHETWIGQTDRIFLSTDYDENKGSNIWTAAIGDSSPRVVYKSSHIFCHVSATKCGNFWIADAPGEENVPIYMGSFESGVCKRIIYSRTQHAHKQWTHTHPFMTADNGWLIFTSTRCGLPQVFGAKAQQSFLDDLSQAVTHKDQEKS